MMNVIRTLLKQQHEHEINDNGKVNKDYQGSHPLCGGKKGVQVLRSIKKA